MCQGESRSSCSSLCLKVKIHSISVTFHDMILSRSVASCPPWLCPWASSRRNRCQAGFTSWWRYHTDQWTNGPCLFPNKETFMGVWWILMDFDGFYGWNLHRLRFTLLNLPSCHWDHNLRAPLLTVSQQNTPGKFTWERQQVIDYINFKRIFINHLSKEV